MDLSGELRDANLVARFRRLVEHIAGAAATSPVRSVEELLGDSAIGNVLVPLDRDLKRSVLNSLARDPQHYCPEFRLNPEADIKNHAELIA